jgi:chromosome partitioning protein
MVAGNTSARLVVAAMAVSGTFAVSGPSASAQRRAPPADRAQPPTELLREYPFRQGRLESRERPRRQQPDTESGDGGWPTIWLVLAGVTALLALGTIVRHAPRPSFGGRNVSRPVHRSRPRRFARPRPGRRPETSYAVVNQKGGVGKTTVSLTLGAAAVRRGKRVLLLDLDPQASATSVVGADVHSGPTITDAMLAYVGCSLSDVVRPTGWGFDLAPADRLLRAADTPIATGDEAALLRQLGTVAEYDLILIDCPPSLGALTINALTAASRALVVTEPTFLALQAIGDLLDTVRVVAVDQNPALELAGLVLNRVEGTAEHKRGVAELEDEFGSQVWEPHVPKRAILQEAMRRGVAPQDLQAQSHYATEMTAIFDALAARIEASHVKA